MSIEFSSSPKTSVQIVARRIVVAPSAQRARYAPGKLLTTAANRLPASRALSLFLPAAFAAWSLLTLLAHS